MLNNIKQDYRSQSYETLARRGECLDPGVLVLYRERSGEGIFMIAGHVSAGAFSI
jgi:hypothetical protein